MLFTSHRYRPRMLAVLACIAWGIGVSGAQADEPAACLDAHEAAQRLRRDGQFLEARKQLLDCAQAACPRVVRNDCAGWANEVDASTPSLVLAVASTRGEDLVDVQVTANGRTLTQRVDGRAIAVDPGVYTLRYEAVGHTPLEQTITVRQAEKNRLVRAELTPIPIAPARSEPLSVERPTRVWPTSAIVLGSVAVAAGGAALGLGLWGKGRLDDLAASCGRDDRCSSDQVAGGKRAYIAADVLAGVAGVTAVSSLWLFVRANRDREARVSAQLHRGGGGLTLQGTF
jgi:hypothetical protein